MEKNTKHTGHFKKWHHLMLHFEDLNQKKAATSAAPESLWPISATVVTTLGFEAWKGATFYHFNWKFSSILSIPFSMVFFLPWISPNLWRNTKKKENGRNEAASSSALISKNKNRSLQGPQRPRPKARSYSSGSPQNHFQFGGGADFWRYLFNKRST